MGDTWKDHGGCVHYKDTVTGVESEGYLSDAQQSMKKHLVNLGYVFCAHESNIYGKFSKNGKMLYVDVAGHYGDMSTEDWNHFENVIKKEYRDQGFEFQGLQGGGAEFLKFARKGHKILVDRKGNLLSCSKKDKMIMQPSRGPFAPFLKLSQILNS
jgi:hypothetical protein